MTTTTPVAPLTDQGLNNLDKAAKHAKEIRQHKLSLDLLNYLALRERLRLAESGEQYMLMLDALVKVKRELAAERVKVAELQRKWDAINAAPRANNLGVKE